MTTDTSGPGPGDRAALAEVPAFPGVTKWRRKSRELEATRWDGTAGDATRVIDWILASDGTARFHDEPIGALVIDIPGGTVRAVADDWIIKRPDGVFWPLAERDFLDLHEPVGVLVSLAGDEAAAAERERIAQEIRDEADHLEVHVTPDPEAARNFVAGMRRAADYAVNGPNPPMVNES